MKKVGLTTVALLAAITLACGGGRDEANTENRDATIGTGGEVANAPTTPGAADTRDQGRTDDVQSWVQEITMHNTAEIELGKLASERAMNAQVKQYGQMMVKDHTMAGNELKQAIAGQVQVQEQMDEKHRDLAEKLRTTQGIEFDREYMNAMVDGHEEVRDLLQERTRDSNTGAAAGSTATTPGPNATGNATQLETAVSQWAAKTLPKVEQHLQQAQQLKERVDSGGRNTTQNNDTNSARPATRPGQ